MFSFKLFTFHINVLMVDTGNNNLCFKFWNFTLKLFHFLCFIVKLVFGLSTSVTKLYLFFENCLGGFRFFNEPAGKVCHASEALSRGFVLLELEMILFLPIIFTTFPLE